MFRRICLLLCIYSICHPGEDTQAYTQHLHCLFLHANGKNTVCKMEYRLKGLVQVCDCLYACNSTKEFTVFEVGNSSSLPTSHSLLPTASVSSLSLFPLLLIVFWHTQCLPSLDAKQPSLPPRPQSNSK